MLVEFMMPVPILPSDGDVLEFGREGNTLTLGGAPVALALDVDADWDWLSNATPEETASLRTAWFEDEVTPERISLLERLALQVPNVGLVITQYSDQNEILPQLLRLFDPEVLFLYDSPIDVAVGALLTREENLRTLTISGEGVSDLGFLGQIPNLRSLAIPGESVSDLGFLGRIPNLETLQLGEWDPEETGPLPDSLPSLKSIFFSPCEMENLNSLGNQPRLEDLTLFCDEESGDSATLDISALANHPRLTTVRLRGWPTVVDLSPLDGLRHLSWLALPMGTTQEQLEQVVRTHTNLTVLELVGSEEISDLTPLTRLRGLKALLVGSTAPHEPLYGMSNLEYLAVVVENGKSPSFGADVLPRLRTELPETVIARVDPLELCLGSGFILLLIPMVGGAWWVIRRRGRGRRPVPHHG